jgi:hypothetical protein
MSFKFTHSPTLYNIYLDKTKFNRELKQLSILLGSKSSLKHYMRDQKGNLQLLPDEEELQKPKKPLTPYMLFVREVFTRLLLE